MLVVYHFFGGDAAAVRDNLLWAKELDGHLDFHCILAHDSETPASAVKVIEEIARGLFTKVDRIFYPAPVKKTWPAAPNHAWQEVARHMAGLFNEPWLFLEADAIPIRKGWLKAIADAYAQCGKVFLGHRVHGMGHLNGTCVYPPVVSFYSKAAFHTEETAWDVVLGKDIQAEMAHSDLFQHFWTVGPDGKSWNGNGRLVTFKSTHDVVRLVNLDAALFHRCKDGTLITQLREHYRHPEIAMVPAHVEHVEIKADDAPVLHADKNFTGQCEILIATYYKDSPWLEWCLRLIRRWCTGFSGITIVIPNRDAAKFAWVGGKDHGYPVSMKLFSEQHGKGFLHHQVMMAGADKLVPPGTTHVLHLDPDCMFREETTPDEYIQDGKPVYVIRTYESLYDKEKKVMSDCAQWKAPTEKQLGFPVTQYTMCRHPSVFPIDFYEQYRKHIEVTQGADFVTYMLAGRNNFPQTRMDFTAMGAYAYEKMRDKFIWIDAKEAPRDKLKAYWSHGGITPEIKAELERFLHEVSTEPAPDKNGRRTRYVPNEAEVEQMHQ